MVVCNIAYMHLKSFPRKREKSQKESHYPNQGFFDILHYISKKEEEKKHTYTMAMLGGSLNFLKCSKLYLRIYIWINTSKNISNSVMSSVGALST